MLTRMRHALSRFREDCSGIITVEMIITLPFLFWMIATSFSLYDVHKFKAQRIKATYTVADLLSREMAPVDTTYINNAKDLFDTVTGDNGTNELRMTVVRFDSESNTYSVRWSETRGSGDMTDLVDADVSSAHDTLPKLKGGEELIIVESKATYKPLFLFPGLQKKYPVTTQVFTGIRFAPQLCWVGTSCG